MTNSHDTSRQASGSRVPRAPREPRAPRAKRGKRAGFARFVGIVCIVLFALDVVSITVFWFHGAPLDTGKLYETPFTLPNLHKFPYMFAAAYTFPPVIFNFDEDPDAADAGGNGGYTWLRMNYLAQIDPPEFNLDHPAIGSPSIVNVGNMRSVRHDLMKQIQSKPHDCPEVVTVLSRRLAELKNGWVAEIDVPSKTLAFYSPETTGAASKPEMAEGPQVAFTPVLQSGATPSITKPLSDYLPSNEYPLAIALGKEGMLLIACSRGTLLKLDSNGGFVAETRIVGKAESKNADGVSAQVPPTHDFWMPVGGIWMGEKLIGVDTVLMLRRIMVVVLLATPLLAYLALAWSRD
jgi:hypothetical protein